MNFEKFYLKPTLSLLSISVVVSISGAAMVYIAFLLLGVKPNLSIPFGYSLIVYAVYTLDRILGAAEEDKINRRIGNINKKAALLIVVFSWVFGILILYSSRLVLSTVLSVGIWPFIIGFLYGKGVKIGRFYLKLKQGLGIKNVIVSFMWASTVLWLVYPSIKASSQLLLLFFFFFLKVFINTVIYDCRDIKGDAIAGLKTLPVLLGEEKTRILLYIFHIILHSVLAIFIFSGLVRFDGLILLYSLFAGAIYITIYTDSRKKKFMDIMIDGEYVHMSIFRSLLLLQKALRSA